MLKGAADAFNDDGNVLKGNDEALNVDMKVLNGMGRW